MLTHCSATAVVVEVHECPSISDGPLFGIDESFGKLNPVVYVVAAATPVKLSSVIARSAALVRIAVARLQLPLTAGSGKRIHHSR